MRFYTEFIILYQDRPMPEPELFCPSFWAAANFDARGDYYAEGVDQRWTELDLTRREPGEPDSRIGVYTLREHNVLAPTLLETEDLQRYLDYKREGRYVDDDAIANIESLAVTSLCFDTVSVTDYGEFLETVHRFLLFTGGTIVNYSKHLDAEQFRARFVAEAP